MMGDKVMELRDAILSEEYTDYFLDFPLDRVEEGGDYFLYSLDERYTLAYSREPVWQNRLLTSENPAGYSYIPGVYGLMENEILFEVPADDTALVISGIKRVQRPPLSLTGKDCVICMIDTGIDYRLPDFQDELGETRILAIWDQNDQRGTPPEGFFYGTLFDREQIQAAIEQEKKGEIKSMTGLAEQGQIGDAIGQEKNESYLPERDASGHGTNMALLAAGRNGAAPDAQIVVVRLKQCKRNLMEYYRIPEGTVCYEGNDIAQAIKFGDSFAKVFQRPVIFCLGLGTNMGDHAGTSFLADYMKRIGEQRNRCMIICGGNEGNSSHHYQGSMQEEKKRVDVELRVGETTGFHMEFWGNQPDVYRIIVISPGGESIPVAGQGLYDAGTYGFVYSQTLVTVESVLVEAASGKELIRFRFWDPTPGIWTFRVEATSPVYNGIFHMWLPITEFVQEDTYFLVPNPAVTVTEPGMNPGLFTVGSYNDENESVDMNSGRGFNTEVPVKPDLVAPGVRVPGKMGKVSGSSYSAAITAGAAAQFMEWAVIRKNSMLTETNQIKNYFIQGAKRKPTYSYPNREWGYGALNLQGVFDVIAGLNG